MQPTIFWWNLTRLGEALGELFGAGDDADSLFSREDFLNGSLSSTELDPVILKAEQIIGSLADEYKEKFFSSYKSSMSQRLGFSIDSEDDFQLITDCLNLLETYQLDFHAFFYTLSQVSISAEEVIDTIKGGTFGGTSRSQALSAVQEFLDRYHKKLQSKNIIDHKDRSRRMKKANPHFVLRSWVLDEAIQKVSSDDRKILGTLIRMATDPFAESWSDIGEEDGKRYCGPVPSGSENTMCSCSS